jgi:molybdopterin-guanine dinucleotide biosynthesis protein MobB
MKVVSVVGFSGTGKTRLIVRLIRELRARGLEVAAVKRCSHGFTLDTEGKDTAAFGRAGASGVAMVSPEGWAAVGPPRPVAARALGTRLFPEADIVLVEGGKGEPGTPRIEILRAGVSDALVSRPEDLLAVVADGAGPADVAAPVLGPDESARLADLILALEEAAMTDIKLEVDGQEVNLNPFVRTIIERTVVAMVTSLSGVDPEPKRIALVIDRGGTGAAPGPKS